jgi:hypothetical protein
MTLRTSGPDLVAVGGRTGRFRGRYRKMVPRPVGGEPVDIGRQERLVSVVPASRPTGAR